MFKERLKQTAAVVLIILGAIVMMVAIALGSDWIQTHVTLSNKIKLDIAYFFMAVAAILVIIGIFKLIQGICWFINWLIIEPIKTSRQPEWKKNLHENDEDMP